MSRVRPYTIPDMERVLELAVELEEELASRDEIEADPGKIRRIFENGFLNEEGYHTVLVSAEKRAIKGFVIGSSYAGCPDIDAYGPQDPESCDSTEISLVYTAADSRKMGIGKSMVGSLCCHVRESYKHTRAEANVASDNHPALGLFRSLGFDEELDGSIYLFTRDL